MRVTIRYFPARKVSGERHRLIYAHYLNAAEDLLDEMSYPSNNGFLRSALINDGASETATSYYDGAHGRGRIAWGIFICIDVVGRKNVVEDCL